MGTIPENAAILHRLSAPPNRARQQLLLFCPACTHALDGRLAKAKHGAIVVVCGRCGKEVG